MKQDPIPAQHKADRPETPRWLLGWRSRQTPNQSQVWARDLPPGPLVQHLTALHAVVTHFGAEGDMLAVAEHHLRDIAVFTQAPNPYERKH
jgi:hypothetical protein